MNIPLFASATNDRIVVVQNGHVLVKHFPFEPYVLANKPYRQSPYHCLDIKRKVIPTLEERTVYRVSAPTINSWYQLRDKLDLAGIKSARLSYLESILIDKPAYFLAHPNTKPLTKLVLDIEVLTTGDGYFPRASKNPIISIAVKKDDEPVRVFDHYELVAGDADQTILRDFREYWKEVNPDILITYNGKQFDLPYILARLSHWGISPDFLSRYEQGKDPLRGRVHFDVYEYALADQNLMGIKSKSQKDVAEWFGRNPVRLKMDNTQALLGTKELEAYQVGDVEDCAFLSTIYLPNAIALAEILHSPLNLVTGCSPSFIPKVVIGRNCVRQDIVAIDTNMDRYQNTDTANARIHGLSTMKFEGAMVKIKKTGYQSPISKLDYASMYPSCIRTLNLGPDTTKIVSMEPYDAQGFKIERDTKAKTLRLSVPDANVGATVGILIDMSKHGLLKEEIERLTKERKEIRAQMTKEKNPGVKQGLDSRQVAIKVVMNSIYGYLGSPYASYGDMASGIATTGFCRWLSGQVEAELGDRIINIDTDGFCISGEMDPSGINQKLKKLVESQTGIESFMVLEPEPLVDGWFYKMKNYLIRKQKEDGEIITIKHGVAFKSSRQAAVVDLAINEVSDKIFGREEFDHFEFGKVLKDMKANELSDFKLRLTFDRPLKDYIEGSIYHKLGMQVEETTGRMVEPGLQIDYYVTKKPAPSVRLAEWTAKTKKTGTYNYSIAAYVDSKTDLFLDYYRDSVMGILDRFEIDHQEQRSLF